MTEFLDWSHIPEKINPTIFSLGPVEIRWYGVLYLLAFLVVYLLVVYRIKKEKLSYSKDTIFNLIFLGIIIAVIGGRIGYVLFYDFSYYAQHPLKIIWPFGSANDGYSGLRGLSYHGSLIGILIISIPIAKIKKINYWHLGDIFASAAPLGYTLGRLANFINGELYGRITTFSLGMYFPTDPTGQLRHPSQLYEALFEGIVLFLVLWYIRNKKPFDGFILCMYIIGYGIIRFLIEFVREPDWQKGFIWGQITMGQLLCLVMIIAGVIIGIVLKIKSDLARKAKTKTEAKA
jgi:phosphatidylglycerol:prolipoprotein diacylglycerol transferase